MVRTCSDRAWDRGPGLQGRGQEVRVRVQHTCPRLRLTSELGLPRPDQVQAGRRDPERSQGHRSPLAKLRAKHRTGARGQHSDAAALMAP